MAARIENTLLGKQYIALEFFSLNRQDKIAFLSVQKKKNELVIVQKEIYNNIEDLFLQKSKYPAALIINNEQVLQKEVLGTDSSDKKLLHKAFPNLQADDFYYEIWRRGTSSLVAICRKTYVNKLLTDMEGGFRIAVISLGVCAISVLSQFELPPLLATNTSILDLDQENIITGGLPENKDYTINELNVPNTHILAFSGVLSLLLPTATTGSLWELGTIIHETFKQKTFFEKGLKTAIVVILTLLVINFFLFSHYFKKANEIADTVALNKSGIENITRIRKRIKDKEQRFESFTGATASASSLAINQLVKDMPASLLLSNIVYHPLEKKVKVDEAIMATESLIEISGSSLSNIAFTNWIESIEKMNWVGKVTINSFGKDAEGNTGFSISITVQK